MPPTFPETLETFLRDPLALLWRNPGIWPLAKPSGPSSNLMVARCRRILNEKRVGHSGTLDPLASGLLLILAGNAARLFDRLQEFPKTYRATLVFGARTDSQDSTGQVLADFVPAVRPPVDEAVFRDALAHFDGEILQTPPMHSALKRDGQPLYKLARQGKTVEREARPVRIYSLAAESFDGYGAVLLMTVSKGFYVRTLVDDIGVRIGCGAVMTALERLAIGPFGLEQAVTLEGMEGKRADLEQV